MLTTQAFNPTTAAKHHYLTLREKLLQQMHQATSRREFDALVVRTIATFQYESTTNFSNKETVRVFEFVSELFEVIHDDTVRINFTTELLKPFTDAKAVDHYPMRAAAGVFLAVLGGWQPSHGASEELSRTIDQLLLPVCFEMLNCFDYKNRTKSGDALKYGIDGNATETTNRAIDRWATKSLHDREFQVKRIGDFIKQLQDYAIKIQGVRSLDSLPDYVGPVREILLRCCRFGMEYSYSPWPLIDLLFDRNLENISPKPITSD